MKRRNRLFVLLGVLVLVCAGIFVLTSYNEKQEQIRNSNEVVLEIPEDSVTALSWQYGDTSLAFSKDGEWHLDADEAFPVSEDKINKLLSQFSAMEAAFIIEDVDNYEQYGLAEPECTIELTTADKSYKIALGAFSSIDQMRYVEIGDGNVYLAVNDPYEDYAIEVNDMIQHDEIPSLDDAKAVTVSGLENYSFSYQEDSGKSYSADDLWFTSDNAPLDSDTVSSYLYKLDSIELEEFVSYNVTDEELESFGLTEPELTLSIDYEYEGEDAEILSDTLVFEFSRNAEELAAAEEAEAAGEAAGEVSAYVRLNKSPIVYCISEANSSSIMAISYNELRHQEIFWGDFTEVTQIDISLEGETHTLVAQAVDEDDADDISWYYKDASEVEEPEASEESEDTEGSAASGEAIEISKLSTALKDLFVSSFEAEGDTDYEEISLTLHLNNDNFPNIKLSFYRYDGNDCLALVDGVAVARIPRSKVMAIVEAVQAIVLSR